MYIFQIRVFTNMDNIIGHALIIYNDLTRKKGAREREREIERAGQSYMNEIYIRSK